MTTDGALGRERLRSLFDLRSDVYATRGGGYTDDPYPTFHRLRADHPVQPGTPHEALGWTEPVFFQGVPYPHRPHFTAYDFQTCSAVLKDDEHFQTNVPALPNEQELPDASILYMDGKQHRRYRRLVQPSFVPGRAVWWLDHWIRGTVTDLIESMTGEDQADLNIELCAAIPMLTITGSFGITVDQALDIRAAVTSDLQQMGKFAELLVPIISARRAEPRDDLISVLVGAEITDDGGEVHRLTDQEVLSFAFLLLAAGSGTTWKQMGIALLALLRDPTLLHAIRDDRALLGPAVEESLRWMPTDPVFSRFVISDCELAGVDLPAGAVIHACLGAANRDPARWDRPDEYDPFRPVQAHLGFGHGPHTCLGSHVARAEIVHAIDALLDRFPDVALDPDAPEPRIIGIYERGPDAVPVRLGRAR